MYPDAIFRISVTHHTFALHGIELDEDFIEVVAQQFCDCHLFFSIFLFAESRTSYLDGATVNEQFNAGDEACIFGGEKDRRLRDLFRLPKAAEWYVRGELGI